MAGEGQVGWGKCLVGGGRLSSLVEMMSFWIWGYLGVQEDPLLACGEDVVFVRVDVWLVGELVGLDREDFVLVGECCWRGFLVWQGGC